MRRGIVRLLTSASVGLGLLAIYIVFLNRFFSVVSLTDMTMTESIILYTQIIRVLILFFLGLRYRVQPIVPIIVLSFEALLIPPLLVLILVTGSLYYNVLMGTILTAWFGATALVIEPYWIFIHARTLASEISLTGVLALGSLELISVLFLSTLLSGTTQQVQGLSGLGTLIISQIRTEIGSSGVPNPLADYLTTVGLVLFFLGSLFYMVLGNYSSGSKIRIPWVLVVSLAGTVLAFIWIYAMSLYQTDIFVVLSAPALAICALIWGASRGS
jgi:hypothetical protein